MTTEQLETLNKSIGKQMNIPVNSNPPKSATRAIPEERRVRSIIPAGKWYLPLGSGVPDSTDYAIIVNPQFNNEAA